MREKGQSFFELLVALVVISISLIILLQLSTKSVTNSTFAKEKTVASRYAQQGLEWIRGERDTSWVAFVARGSGGSGTVWCLTSLSWPAGSGACGATAYITNTVYKRQVTLRVVDPDTVEATVVTTWQDAVGVHQSQASTLFTNWKSTSY